MLYNKAVALHNVSRNYLTIIHPAQIIHPIIIHFAKGLCQLSTSLTRHSTFVEISLLSPHAKQSGLTPHCSRDSELQPVLQLFLVDAFPMQFQFWLSKWTRSCSKKFSTNKNLLNCNPSFLFLKEERMNVYHVRSP